jgi:hypothetical protein
VSICAVSMFWRMRIPRLHRQSGGSEASDSSPVQIYGELWPSYIILQQVASETRNVLAVKYANVSESFRLVCPSIDINLCYCTLTLFHQYKTLLSLHILPMIDDPTCIASLCGLCQFDINPDKKIAICMLFSLFPHILSRYYLRANLSEPGSCKISTGVSALPLYAQIKVPRASARGALD